MIRLVLMIPTLDRGGAEKQLTLLATHLPRDHFDVTVCTLTRDGPYREELERAGIPIVSLGKRWKIDPLAWRRTVRFLREHRPDIVHTWLFAANAYGRSAALAAHVPHIVGAERCADHWKVWHELAIDRFLARRSDRLVTNSVGVVEFYARHGISADRFVVIPNAIEPYVPPSESTAPNWRQELGLPADAKLVGAVGRLWPQKRTEDLIWASELLRVVRDDVFFLFAGEGPQRRSITALRDTLKLQGRVFLLGHREDVPDWLEQLDLFWTASGYEGQSNAVMEAMRAGLPVIASDLPGHRELITPGETGWLVPVGDRAEFARRARWVLEHPQEAAATGQAAARRMAEAFSVQAMVERYVAFYEEIVSGTARSPADATS